MTRFISRPLPRSLYGHIVGVMLIGFACVMVIGPLCERIARSSYFGVTDMDAVVERAVTVGALLRAADTGERQAMAARRAGMAFEIMDAARTSGLPEISAWRMPLGGLLQTLFPPNPWPAGVTQRMLDGRPALVLQLDRDASLVRLDLPDTLLTIQVVNPATYYFLAFVALLGLISLFAMRAITRPLKAMIRAVEMAEPGGAGHLFAERGSVEIVGLAQAPNRMRARLQVMLDNRAHMLRSVSHDLRTPLTRLRLMTERMGEGAPRDAMLADIGQIERLVESTLDYLRYDASSEAPQRADIAGGLQTVCLSGWRGHPGAR